MTFSVSTVRKFQQVMWHHYCLHKRMFPWRTIRDPYKIFVSEIMLQQTQADRVVPFFKRFVSLFSNPKALDRAPLQSVLRAWSGLGYNRRALYAKRAARVIVGKHEGKFPRDAVAIHALPGAGDYTTAAVQVFAFNMPIPILVKKRGRYTIA